MIYHKQIAQQTCVHSLEYFLPFVELHIFSEVSEYFCLSPFSPGKIGLDNSMVPSPHIPCTQQLQK